MLLKDVWNLGMLSTGGSFCGTPGASQPDGECLAGYYCETGVDTATPTDSGAHKGIGGQCPLGSYCPKGSTTPTPCAAGSFTSVKRKGPLHTSKSRSNYFNEHCIEPLHWYFGMQIWNLAKCIRTLTHGKFEMFVFREGILWSVHWWVLLCTEHQWPELLPLPCGPLLSPWDPVWHSV